MAFMRLFTAHGPWAIVTDAHGSETVVDADLADGSEDASDYAQYVDGEPAEVRIEDGWCARYSAPGYMDCTEWCGPYATEGEARAECIEIHGDDESEES